MSSNGVQAGQVAVKAIERVLIELERRQLLQPINTILSREGVLIEEVLGDSRHKPIARARHQIWLWIRQEKGWSYPAIASLFNRDHTTIMAGVAKAGQELGLVEFAGKGKKGRAA